MRVLVTSIGSTPSLGVVKFIKAIKRNIEIVGTDINFSNRIAGSSFVDDFFTVPVNTDPRYLEVMLKIVEDKKIEILIPIHDYEVQVLSKEIEKFKSLGCFLVVSDAATVNTVNDKYVFAKSLTLSNISTPATYTVEEWIEMKFEVLDCWIMKPLHGLSSRGIYNGSTNVIKQIIEKKEINQNTYIIQQFISGKEYTVDVFVKSKQAFCIVPRVRDEIREGLCYKSYTVSNEEFLKPIRDIISLFDFYGPINIQFIKGEKNKLYCIECNPRFGGSSVNTLYAGINLFQFILDDFEGKKITYCNDYKKIYMTRYWEEVIYEN
ncbi:ATP-grasp domain-containing protein [soil metagenome]